MRLNAKRGSERYHSAKSVMACSQLRRPLLDVRLFYTADFDCSRSESARTRLGDRLYFLVFGMAGGLLGRRWFRRSKSPGPGS